MGRELSPEDHLVYVQQWKTWIVMKYFLFCNCVYSCDSYPGISDYLILRCLLRLMCSSYQVCGFLRQVSPAPDALPVLSRMLLTLQL